MPLPCHWLHPGFSLNTPSAGCRSILQPPKATASSKQTRGNTQLNGQADAVGKFYDNTTDAFLQVYGEVIQAFRTKDVSGLLHYQASAMGLKPGMRLLDAGCGVCGPAIFFAKNYGVEVDAVTASEIQAEIAAKKIEAAGMSHLVTPPASRRMSIHLLRRSGERAYEATM